MINLDDLKKTLGSRIFLLRTINNVSQDYLSRKVGANRNLIYRYEHAITMPSIKVLANIANFYDIPLQLFFASDKEFDSYLEQKQMNII